MAEAPSSELPAWVRKRDGRLQAFNVDNISASLFNAAESLGEANAFLARELTQSVLYFLGRENAGSIVPAAHIGELATKVVRELGHPRLAQALAAEQATRLKTHDRGLRLQFPAAASLEEVTRGCRADYSLANIYGRDLAAAHREGLLQIFGLEQPRTLLGRVCELGIEGSRRDSAQGLADFCWQALCRSSHEAGGFTVIDGIEYLLARVQASPAESGQVLRAIKDAAGTANLAVVVNVNCAQPPAWVGNADSGPLFSDAPDDPVKTPGLLDTLLDILDDGLVSQPLFINWHLQQQDFETGGAPPLLVQRVAANPHFALTFDRPRQSISLGEGIDRTRPGTLLAVGLNLPQILERRLVKKEAEEFLGKLGTLAQMAVSAAVQKRRYLRTHNQLLGREFLLDRARLVVAPVGLEEVARQLTGERPCVNQQALDFARQAISVLISHLHKEGRAANVEVCLDGGWIAAPNLDGVSCATARGVTFWDEQADARSHLRAAATLHSVSGGTATIILSPEKTASLEDISRLIQFACTRTDITRLVFRSQREPPGMSRWAHGG